MSENSTPRPNDGLNLTGDHLLSSIPVDKQERRAFDVYLRRAAPVFAGSFDSILWCQLIPQVSQSEPAVCNAVLAVGHLFEHSQRPVVELEDDRKSVPVHRIQAMKWYNKAIENLQIHIRHNKASPSMALLTCVLFICIESQQDNVLNGLALLDQGVNMLSSTLTSISSDSGQHAKSALWDVVLPFFSRHTIMAATVGQPLPLDLRSRLVEEEILVTEPLRIIDLEDARGSLYTLMYHSYDLLRITVLLQAELEAAARFRPRRDRLLAKLEEWKVAVHAVAETISSLKSACELSMLLMYYNVTCIWLATCLDPCQTAFDMHTKSFQEILRNARTYLLLRSRESAFHVSATSEMGIIPPLYFVVTKCRHPCIRRDALKLLQRAPQQEGLWRALPIAQVSKLVIEIEEEGIKSTLDGCSSTVVENFPDEERRIHNLEVIRTATPNQGCGLAVKILRFRHGSRSSRPGHEDIYWL